MKFLPFIFILFLVATLSAAPVQIAWNASPSAGVTYRVYAWTNAANVKQFDAGANLNASLTNLPPGLWHVTATAINGGVESDPSAEMIFEMPEAPTNLRTVIIQYSGDLTNTNAFKDVGFFRLKIP